MDIMNMHLRRYLDEGQGRGHPVHPTPTQDNSSSADHNHSSSNNMATTTTTTNMVVVGVLVGLICILTCVLILLLIRPVMDFLRARLPESKRRKELRYRTVEGWVISKRLRGHDEFCSHALAFASESPKDKFHQGGGGGGVLTSTPSYDTAETAEQSIDIEWTECPICMEEFKQGEIVSWSPDDETRCQHFFHHECIKEWLLRSPHCPYCRGTIIPVDETPAGSRVDKMALHEMSRRRTTKANTTYCCAEHGLVSLQRKAMGKLSKRDKQVLDAVLAPHVDPVELKTKRGGRQEEQQHTVTGNNGAGMSSNGSDSEFSSGPLQNGNTTILDAVHVVPVDALIADMEAGQTHEAFEVAPSPSAESKEESSGEGISTSVPDIESPPASGGK